MIETDPRIHYFRGSSKCDLFVENASCLLSGFTPTLRAIASSDQQDMITNRTSPNEATSLGSRAYQQNQQYSDYRDRGASQVLGSDILCPVHDTFFRKPAGYE